MNGLAPERRDVRIAIIGAGPGGLCTGKRLLDEGFGDFVILEKSDGVGGTWHRNRYPGCECDVPSALYSFSFEFKTDWSKPYGTQPEILDYMQRVAQKYGLLPHCRFGSGVTRAQWNEESATWTLTLESGHTVDAEIVVSAIGMFNDLAWPDIEGLDRFRGTMFHSADWNRDHDLAGERVAVIGSAASAVQFVPEIVKVAGRVHLFQRTANWVLPKIDTPYTPEQLDGFRADPTPLLEFRALVVSNMNKGMTFADPKMCAEREAVGLAAIDVVRDPEVRRKLRPNHPYGAKRPLMSNYYYQAFNEPNLELVTEPIARIADKAVVTADGAKRKVDTIIIATGFATTKYLSAIDVIGRDGRRIEDAWNDGPIAYLGITTSGFPNLFMLYGPNTNNGSILTMIEYQANHILAHVRRIANDVAWIDARPETMQRYNDEVQQAIAGIRVWQGDVNGYYRTAGGRNVTQWPFSMTEFEQRTATIDPDAFEVALR
jgi:cation diffusion facilitator CzcD-associated flavoprotein CzcO